jgi:hypothetical protein
MYGKVLDRLITIPPNSKFVRLDTQHIRIICEAFFSNLQMQIEIIHYLPVFQRIMEVVLYTLIMWKYRNNLLAFGLFLTAPNVRSGFWVN